MMRGAQVGGLLGEAPEGVAEVLGLVAGFDRVLGRGLARLGDEDTAALQRLAGTLGASPLGGPLAEAAAKILAGSVTADGLAAFAAARTALLGAVHDALLARLDGALGRTRSAWDGPPPTPGDADASVSGWLTEVAITGWRGVDTDLVAAAEPVVETLWERPERRRLAVVLDGLVGELRASSPVARLERLPERRWADLWTRAVLLARRGAEAGTAAAGTAEAESISGRLLPLGVDIHEHGTALRVRVHAVLETPGQAPRLVRCGVTAAKADVIVGPAVWRLLSAHPTLLTALAERRSIEVTELPLLPGGELVWRDEQARLGEAADPFTTARMLLVDAEAPAAAPVDRHPAHIAEPVLVEGYQVGADGWTLDGQPLTVEADGLPTAGPLTPALLAKSRECIGLLRWDARAGAGGRGDGGGGWSLRPLAVRTKSKAVHNGDLALTGSGKDDPVAVLRERAGRLLRA